MSDNVNDKWQPVEDADLSRRSPNEWARIYNIKLLQPAPAQLWNEYEWAYNMMNLRYNLLPDTNKNGKVLDSYEKAELMELRAMELKRDLFMGADMGEKYVLEKQYTDTEWIRKRVPF